MKNYLITILLLLGILFSCTSEKQKRIIDLPRTNLAKEAMIPIPLEIMADSSAFPLDRFTAIYTTRDSTGFEGVGDYLAEKIKEVTPLRPIVNGEPREDQESVIYIVKKKLISTNPEAYELRLNKDSLILSASTADGAFRGVQTLRQLMPQNSTDTLAKNPIWILPSGTIRDVPLFAHRGAMLDVARHFFSVEDVKKYIDLLAYYKYNVLHLHLTDDQGWRIEIKSWPKLAAVGGLTEVGGTPGGFYTQEDYKNLVAYAASRHMTIIPEIDLPGHTNAASVAYLFLNGNGKTPEPYHDMRVGFSTLDTRKDSVYGFVDDVVRELAAITPGPYLHIGGDESHSTKKEDYNYFIEKMEKIVQKYGKRMIGWDEVATAAIDSTSIVQYWSSAKNAKSAVAKNMKLILSPAKRTYLDMKYDLTSKHGLDWAGHIPVDSAYIWTPESYEGIPFKNILGIEAPLWSETISDISELEYLAFPRAIGIAELGWSTPERRGWVNYKVRLGGQAAFLERMKVNYFPSALVEWERKEKVVED